MFFTEKYLATAPHATVRVLYPDGAVYEAAVLDDGNGRLAAMVRAAAGARPGAVGALSRELDQLRESHAAAYAKDRRPSAAWAVAS